MTIILLAALLAAPRANKAPPPPEAQASQTAPALSDQEIQQRLRAYLGSIDTPVPAARWRELGPRAGAMLQQIALDPNQMPSRRAKAVSGLSLAAPDQAGPVLTKLAADESQSVSIRIAAVHGMAAGSTPEAAAQKVSPLLRGASDPGVRAVAAEVVAASGSQGCAQVKAQVAREEPVQRPAFRRALARCGE
jgi:hypothetical protein